MEIPLKLIIIYMTSNKINLNFSAEKGWHAHFYFLYLSINLKREIMYSLDCKYYRKKFNTVTELLEDVVSSGMDPNYEITRNGKGTGEMIIDLIQF